MELSYPFITEKYTNEIVTLETARSWLEMDIQGYTGKDDLINKIIGSAVRSVETDCNFQLGISTYTWNTDCRPCEFRDTFYIKSIESISYKGGESPGEDGYSVINSDSYELVQVSKRRTKIIWNDGVSSDSCRHRIVFTAGLAEGEVPEDLLRAIRIRISDDYNNGGDTTSEKRTLSDKLIAPYIIGYAG